MKISLIPAAFDCLRYGGAVNDAVKTRSRAALVVALVLFISAAVRVINIAGYGSYVAFLDADTIQYLACFVGAGVASFGHFATDQQAGLLPPKLGTDSNGSESAAKPDTEMASGPAVSTKPVEMRPAGSPDGSNYLPG